MGRNPEEMGIGIDPDGPFDSIHQFYFFRVRVRTSESGIFKTLSKFKGESVGG